MPKPLPILRRPDGGPAFAPLIIAVGPGGPGPADLDAILEDLKKINSGGISVRLELAGRILPTCMEILAREGRLEEEVACRSALNHADTLLGMHEKDMNPEKKGFRVRVLKTVRSELPFPPFLTAKPGEYDAEENPQGAVSVILPDPENPGDFLRLGVKPDEFERLR